nr:leucine-zipper-like transcriptional regulator 1 [Vanessa tameamea]
MWVSVDSGGAVRTAPCARGKHSATLLGGYVYVLGGRGAGGSVPLRDFWRYCLATSRWERLEARGEPPPALQEHTATTHGNKLYVFGGEAGALSNETPLWIYDTEIETWRKLPGQSSYSTLRRRGARDARAVTCGPRGRRGHSAHALKDCLLIYGGYKDLRGSTNELWAFHYESESWHQVRTSSAGPARHRHAAALHDNRLYVHGGQCDLRDCADLWHYDTSAPPHAAPAPAGFLREISKLSSFHIRRAARCSYTVLAGERDSTESLLRTERSSLSKSRSAYVIDERQPADGGESPREERLRCEVSRDPISVPDFADMVLPTPVLSPVEAARLVYFDSEEEEDMRRELAELERSRPRVCVTMSKSASVRFTREPAADTAPVTEDEAELSTSDYASAERVNGVSGASSGFSNPHYLGPDIGKLGSALTPDSGVGPGDIELQDLGERRARSVPRNGERQLHLLLVGGKEPPHLALLQSPLSMWSYRLL